MSILKGWLRVKAANARQVTLGLLVFLAATVAFSAGYLTAQDGGRNPIVIEKCSSAN